MNESQISAPRANRKRKALLAGVIGAFALAGAVFAVYWYAVGRFSVTTEDAYVGGNVVEITPRVAGTVVAIEADDTEHVAAGDALVLLDPVDTGVALESAKATLAQTVREVRGVFAHATELESEVAGREVDVAKARADLKRREGLERSGAVSAEELHHAREALRTAESALAAVREQLAATRALVDGTTVASHPKVERAAADVRTAYLDDRRTLIPAPVSGVVAKRSVQLGQRVSPGTPLMAIVPPDQVWVDANFKEIQLERVRVGQPARVVADANGFEYHGTVVGFEAGTGAAFALLPPQNATGNWIKVVQRLPVRIALDPDEVEAHPLAIGLSMEVTVDVRDDGEPPARVRAPGAAGYRTTVYAEAEREADALIAEIIERNGGAAAGTLNAGAPHVSHAPRQSVASAADGARRTE